MSGHDVVRNFKALYHQPGAGVGGSTDRQETDGRRRGGAGPHTGSGPGGGVGADTDPNAPVSVRELGEGVTGEEPLRPKDFCELGTEAGGAVDAVQAAGLVGRVEGEVAAGEAAGGGTAGTAGGGLLPGEGGVEEDVVVVGGKRGAAAREGLSSADYEDV